MLLSYVHMLLLQPEKMYSLEANFPLEKIFVTLQQVNEISSKKKSETLRNMSHVLGSQIFKVFILCFNLRGGGTFVYTQLGISST